jgi:hypothetical protein
MKQIPVLLFFSLLAGCGSGVPQRAACGDFVACVQARDMERGTTTNLTRFEPDGACWGGDEGADLCETACINGLEFLASSYVDLPEVCTP